MILNNSGAGRKIMFFPFFLIMLVIAAGIFLGVQGFYGKGYAFKHVEAELLSQHVRDCFETHDFFGPSFNDTFLSDCRLNNVILTEHLIYVNRTSDGAVFFVGVLDYTNQCFFDATQSNPDFPYCTTFSVMKDGISYDFIIGTNQHSKRLAL